VADRNLIERHAGLGIVTMLGGSATATAHFRGGEPAVGEPATLALTLAFGGSELRRCERRRV
jgi:hypothetical protein